VLGAYNRPGRSLFLTVTAIATPSRSTSNPSLLRSFAF
jgi:hypothetical protein